MASELVTQSYVPPELALDEYHPHNTAFFKAQRQLKQVLAAAALNMKKSHVEIAKLAMRGHKHVDMAAELGLAPSSVSTILRRDDVRKLIETMAFLNALNEGPTIELRKRKLWEIALDNQDTDPKTSISAIGEMNRMDGIGRPNANVQADLGNGVVIKMSFGPPPPNQPPTQHPIKDVTPVDGD
jgi:hypothetical protein